MLTFLFWNLGRKSLDGLLAKCVRERNVDVVMLAEFGGDPGELCGVLGESTERPFRPTFAPASKIDVVTSLPENTIRPVQDNQIGRRMTVRRVVLDDVDILLAIVHAPSKLHWTDDDQSAEAREIASSLRQVEERIGHDRTVLVGDLNMNPFEPGMVAANGFHGVMTREVARSGNRTVQDREYPFFYNPMWSCFGDRSDGPSGSYFHSGGGKHVAYFWHLFDQLLIRPSLLDVFADDVEIVTTIGSTSLVRDNGVIDANVASDHLPLLFRLDL